MGVHFDYTILLFYIKFHCIDVKKSLIIELKNKKIVMLKSEAQLKRLAVVERKRLKKSSVSVVFIKYYAS